MGVENIHCIVFYLRHLRVFDVTRQPVSCSNCFMSSDDLSTQPLTLLPTAHKYVLDDYARRV
jgi:hypothetical protein